MPDQPRKRSGGPSGRHTSPRRKLTGRPDFAAQDAAAAAQGLAWTDWAWAILERAARRKRGEHEERHLPATQPGESGARR